MVVARSEACRRCGGRSFWLLQDGRRRCTQCRFDWKPQRLPLRLSEREWRQVLHWFVLGMPSRHIARETKLERKRVLRALTVIRSAIAGFTVEPQPIADTSRLPALIGLSVADGQAVAEVAAADYAEAVLPMLAEDATPPSSVAGVNVSYGALVYRGKFVRTTPASGESTSFGTLESFWAYLRQRLRSKGGVRRARLGLYLAEYAWRYNHRAVAVDEQERELLGLLRRWPLRGERVGLSQRHSAAERATDQPV